MSKKSSHIRVLTFAIYLCQILWGSPLQQALQPAADQPGDPLAVYKTGDYDRAIPLLQKAVTSNPKDPAMQAALLSALVYRGQVDDASDAAAFDLQNFRQSADVLAARGDFAFYMGDMTTAENLYRASLRISDKTARALYGLHRIHRAASMYRSARLLCIAAHQFDPDDALITLAFIGYVVPERRKEMLPDFAKSHPWFFNGPLGSAEQLGQTESELHQQLNARQPFEPDGPLRETVVPLHFLHNGTAVYGVGIDISINGSKPLRVLLDTGASGLLLTQSAIDKAGLTHVGSFHVGGLGDKGPRGAFLSVADTCSIANLKFKTCVFAGTEGKGKIAGDQDGLLGPDLFSDYLITIDFQKVSLHLVPLPERKPDAQGYNREPLAGEAGFTPVFRFGHHLYVSTKVNGKAIGLFLIDTGSSMSAIDATFARLTTKIYHNEYFEHVTGVSGKVNEVFQADKAELQFSRFRQSNLGLTSINLNSSSGHQAVRMDGILGFPILKFFRLTLDYRNGLVNFDYTLDRR